MNEMERGSEVRNLVPPNFPVNLRFSHKSLGAVELAGSFRQFVAHRQILPRAGFRIWGPVNKTSGRLISVRPLNRVSKAYGDQATPASIILIAAGPTRTTKIPGKMKSTIGNNI